jgi:restriction endonuclease Mrr
MLLIIGCVVILVGALSFWSKAKARRDQLDAAVALVNEHAEELRLRRRQLTVAQNYGLIDVSKWSAEIGHFVSRVIETHVGRLSERNEAAVLIAIQFVTKDFATAMQGFSPNMDPLLYEMFVADTLKSMGWSTRITKGSGDQGIDVVGEMRGKKVVIQCKLYSKPVGNDAVQEAIAGKQFERADCAAVVTNVSYTAAAKELASATRTLLLTHEQLGRIEEELFGTQEWRKAPASQGPKPPPRLSGEQLEGGMPRKRRDAFTAGGAALAIAALVYFNLQDSSDPSTASSTRIDAAAAISAPTTTETPPAKRVPAYARTAVTESGSSAPQVEPAVVTHETTEASDAQASPAGSADAPSTPIRATTAPDDLAAVRNQDPSAADHIATFCQESILRRGSNESLCRMHEVAAWKRIYPNHEFPGLDTTLEAKCREPPFPNSFEGLEACARYLLTGR